MMKILVVDDEQDVKFLFLQKFRREIRSNALQFIFAFSGEEALDKFKHLSEETNLILSDINMPGMNGLQLLEIIKTEYSVPPPIVMITAYADESNYQKARELGADDFLTKPVDFKLLKQKLVDFA